MPDEPTPTDIEVPDNFEGLSDDDLRELHGRLDSRFTELRPEATTRSQADDLRRIRDHQRRIAEEIGRRDTEAREVSEALGELDAPVELPTPEVEGDGGGDGGAQPPVTALGQPEEPERGSGDTSVPTGTPLPRAAAIAASRTTQTRAEQAPVPAARPRVAFRAAASQQVVPFGAEMSLEQMAHVAQEMKGAIRPSGGEQVRGFIASIPRFDEMGDPGIPVLSRGNSTAANDQLIREAVEAHEARRAERMGRTAAVPAGRTAAICDPLDIIREIPNYTSDADPFGDAFPQRPAGRLGFTYTQAITLASVSGGVNAGWDETDQANVDPNNSATWKPCIDVDCPSPSEVLAEAVTACFTFDVTTDLSNPERIADFMRKIAAQRVRARTVHLLNLVDALSITYTDTGDYGTWPAVVKAMESIIARAVYQERLDREDYTLFLPPGFAEALITDLHGQSARTEEEYDAGVADVIARLRATFGVDVVNMRDEQTDPFGALPAAGTSQALPDLPDLYTLRLLHTGSALYFSTGEVQTGIQADPQLVRQNKRQWFSEEYVGLARHGSPPWFILDLTTCPTGARSALATPFTC